MSSVGVHRLYSRNWSSQKEFIYQKPAAHKQTSVRWVVKRELYSQMLNLSYFTLLPYSLSIAVSMQRFRFSCQLHSLKWTYLQGWHKRDRSRQFLQKVAILSHPFLQLGLQKSRSREYLKLFRGVSAGVLLAAFINLSDNTYVAPGTKDMSQMEMNLTKWCSVFWLSWCMDCPLLDIDN